MVNKFNNIAIFGKKKGASMLFILVRKYKYNVVFVKKRKFLAIIGE